MTGAEGLGSAASTYFLQPRQTTSAGSGSLSGGEGARGITGGEGGGPSVSTSISPLGQVVSNLQQIQAQNPTQFQQIVGQIATQLQAAAQQQGQSGGSSSFLTALAQNFQNVANGGDISQLEPSQNADHSYYTYDSSGQAVPSTASSTGTTGSGMIIQQTIASIATDVAKALGS